jgi:serine-type D-Ala-D-Ala carboxypeptidase/endopeptidase (penicillin-binding protein 4)
MPVRRPLAIVLTLVAALPAAAPARAQDADRLERELRAAARPAGGGAGFLVLDASDREVLFALRDRRARVMASSTKLFTTAAALGRIGADATIETVVLGDGVVGLDGAYGGDLYLRGGGDPAFGTAGDAGRRFGSPATVDALADQLVASGVRSVSGRVVGDESAYDALRGGPDSNWGPSPWHGPLSALSLDEGRGARGAAPPVHAARALDDALEERGVRVRRAPATAPGAPPAARRLAGVSSLPVARLVRITNKASSNFFAEMLLKRLAVDAGERGTTRGGASVAAAHARSLGAPAQLADGSGLSRGNRASPRAIVRLLDVARGRSWFPALRASLPVAGRDGTLDERMERGAARGRCRAKTGTLSGVSALSGYCTARSGRTVVFSFLANGVNTTSMKRIEDRMANAIVRWG